MALSAQVTKLLNDFAKSQIALRLPNLPLGKSDPKLGDALNAALAAAASAPGSAATDAYTAGTSGNWTTAPPTNVGAALDRIAAALVAAGHTP